MADETTLGGRRWIWPALPVVAAFAAMRGVFTLSNVFDVRDTSFMFWPYHQWFRATAFARESFLWVPYPAFGQSAISEPTRQLLFPPVVLVRLLCPEILGFNLSVALPFPIAGLGAYAFLRRHVSPSAASIGATVFAVCGSTITTG